MTTIYKYQIPYDFTEVNIPEGAEILSMQLQNGIPCIWAMVDTGQPKIKRKFMIVGTGKELHPCVLHTFIGTYQVPGFVFHVFEIPNPK